MTSKVTHKKTGQALTKVDRSKHKARPVQQIIKEQGLDKMQPPKSRAQQKLDAAIAKMKNPAPGLQMTHVNGKGVNGHADLPKMKQQTLPGEGMAPTVHKAVNAAAEELGDAKERCASSQKHKKAREEDLIREMRKVNLTHYVNRGLNIEIIIESPDRVKLKKYNHEDDAAEYP